jgi:hypothetical protein
MTWIVTTCWQFLFEPAYGAGTSFQAQGATIGCVYLGFFIMPAYLDHSVRTTPYVVDPQDYGLPADANAGRPDLLVTRFYGSDPPLSQEQVQGGKPSARDKFQLPKFTTGNDWKYPLWWGLRFFLQGDLKNGALTCTHLRVNN